MFLDIYKWLSIVHNTSTTKIKDRLLGLKAMSILEDIGDNVRGVIIHDLYYDFAKLEVKRGRLDSRRWVWYEGEYPTDLAQSPSSRCWRNLKRVYVKKELMEDGPFKFINKQNRAKKRIQWTGKVEGIKWQHFSNIVVLQLLIDINEVLNFQGLQCLRSLDLVWREDYYGFGEGKLIGLGELRSLRWLKLGNIHFAPCIEEIGCLIALEVLWLNTGCRTDTCDLEQLSPPNLDKCTLLQELVLHQCKCLKTFPNLSKLSLLRKVIFKECNSAKEVVGLTSEMCSLRELVLIECFSLSHLRGLGDLVSLQELCITYCGLQELLDFHKLTSLQRLEYLNGGSIIPRFGSFTALEELTLDHLGHVRELPDMHKLLNLRRFTIRWAPNLMLEQVVLGDLVALQYLRLEKCGVEVGEAELPDLHRLTNLQILELTYTPIRSLPSLEHLTQLRKLMCSFTKLVELPNLTGLILLEGIDLCMSRELTSLGNLANLPALEYLNVNGCYRLEMLPDLMSFKRLQYLYLCGSGVRLSSEEILVLVELPVSLVIIFEHLEFNFREMLEVMPLTDVVTKIEVKQFEYFATPPILFSHECICRWEY